MINWQSITKTCADTVIVNTYDPNQANANLNSGPASESNLAVLTFPSTHTTLEQAAIIAQNQKNALQSQSEYFMGETGRLDITVGMLVRIDRSQNASANDSSDVSTYLITSIKTNAEAQGLNTYHCQFSAVDAYASDYHPICMYQKPQIFSLQTATVITQGAEPVMVSAGLQVKVRFLWEDDNARAENCAWIRVMQASAGNNWGMVWVPRVDDEVLVSFENGDIDHPVIIGSAYNSVKMPAFDLADQYATTAIKMASISKDATDSTRSNELIFNNEMDQECITIKAQRDFTQVIENNALTVVQGTSTTQVLQGDMTIAVEKGGLVAQSTQSITLQVGGTKLVMTPSGINFIGALIELNSSSSGSGTPGNLDAKVIDDNTQKKTYGAIQNDVTPSDSPPLEIRRRCLL
jgi:type VI secretion system secreted protein VgrG